MVAAILFTQSDPYLGLAATDLFRVKGMTGLVIAVDGTEWRYPAGTMSQKRGGETEVLLLRRDDAPLNLATVPQGVAAAVVDSGHGWIFWFDKGRCVQHDGCRSMAEARSQIESRCCAPNGYELREPNSAYHGRVPWAS
jgi:hypothetical protein